MITCGINPCKAKATKSVIINAFEFYDIKRHRFNVIEERSICRHDLICNFKCECMMTPLEALIAYNIIKRAVKAFHHGTPDHSIRSPITEAVILKEHEFIWQHAATRTIQMFEPYENVFYQAHRNYDKEIVEIYRKLYERLKNRSDPVIVKDCQPRGCVRKVIIGTKSPPKLEKEKNACVEKCSKIDNMRNFINNLPDKTFPLISDDDLYKKFDASGKKEIIKLSFAAKLPVKRSKKPKNIDLQLPHCYQCNCPQLICDCNVEKDTGLLAIDCSQGPYECQWFRMDKQDKPDPCIENRELHQCPVDCLTSESSSESDKSEYCECSDEDVMDESNQFSEGEKEFEKTNDEKTLDENMANEMPNEK